MIKINIRWSDIDANRHLANSAYINFMSYARVVFIKDAGITQQVLAQLNLGPIVFYEHLYYFKEVLPDQPIFINVQLKGMSENGCFFSFEQEMYNQKGENVAAYEMMGAWMDLKSRKLTALPGFLMDKFNALTTVEDFKILTKEDTRKHQKAPHPIDPKIIKEALRG